MISDLIAEADGVRIDSYLASETELSRNRLQNLIKDGLVTVNGDPVKPNYLIHAGDLVRICDLVREDYDVEPENIPIDIIYEDEDLCVVNKPQGMVVHPAPGHTSGTLVNALLYHIRDLSTIGGIKRPGIVHRIDRMTSGLLVVAKNDRAHQNLSMQFADHSAGRKYLAIVNGNIREDRGTVNEPIGRHRTDRKKMSVREDGKPAVTNWRVLRRFTTHTLIEAELETGRTHQIRVHMAFIKHPVTGDDVYGSGKNTLGLSGQALHGYFLHFVHPTKNEEMKFEVPLPEYFLRALKKLGWEPSGDGLTVYENLEE